MEQGLQTTLIVAQITLELAGIHVEHVYQHLEIEK